MNLPALQAQARLRNEIKATKTITITVGAYFFCYVPVIMYAVVGQQDGSQTDSWFAFVFWYVFFFSTAVNPIIYYLRTTRFRSAFKQVLKAPCGSSDFKEKPSGRGKGRDKPIPVRVAPEGGAGCENASEIQVDGSQARPSYQRNVAFLRDLEAGERSEGGRPRQQRGDALGPNSVTLSGADSISSFTPSLLVAEYTEACISKLQALKPSEGEGEEIEDASVEDFDKNGLNGSRKGAA